MRPVPPTRFFFIPISKAQAKEHKRYITVKSVYYREILEIQISHQRKNRTLKLTETCENGETMGTGEILDLKIMNNQLSLV